jgi:hypothetical protein
MLYSIDKNVFLNTKVFEENKLAPRAYFVPFGQKTAALSVETHQKRYKSDRVMCLNGEWDFYSYEKFSKIPKALTFDNSLNFEKVSVPHVMGRRNAGSAAIYRRKLVLDEVNKTFIISFLGLGDAFCLYVNAKYVGYSTGAYNGAEFNITNFLSGGENEILVFAYCEAADGENEAYAAGMFRDVLLFTNEKAYVYDFSVKNVSNGNNFDMFFNATVENGAGCELEVSLFDGEKLLATEQKEAQNLTPFLFKNLDVAAWNAEIPKLYSLQITLKNGDDTVEFIEKKIGFKEVVTERGALFLNGKNIILDAVNRADVAKDNEIYGAEHILSDIKRFKECNVNTVKTFNYPADPLFLELADEFGLYIVNEPDTYFAKVNGGLSIDNYWARIGSLFERDKNSVSVLSWSLGGKACKKVELFCYKKLKAATQLPICHSEAAYSVVKDMKMRLGEKVFCPLNATDAAAVKNAYSPLNAFATYKKNMIEVVNINSFKTTEIKLVGALLESGRKVSKFTTNLSIPPEQKELVDLGADAKEFPCDTVLHLDYFAKDGFLIAQEEIRINEKLLDFTLEALGDTRVNEMHSVLIVYFGGGQVLFNKRNGHIIDYQKDKINYLLRRGLNCKIGAAHQSLLLSKAAGYANLGSKFENISWKKDGNLAIIDLKYTLTKGKKTPVFTQEDRYTIHPNGVMTVASKLMPLNPKMPPLPRVGTTFAVSKNFDNVTYYGAGSFDNYPDFKSQARLGVFKQQYSDFVGNRADTRYAVMRNEKGDGLLFAATAKPFNFCIEGTNVSIDGFVGATVSKSEKYILRTDRMYEYSFTVVPLLAKHVSE